MPIEPSSSVRQAQPIEQTVAYRMYRTSRLMRHLHYLTFQKYGFDLTPEQWFILNKLAARSPQSQTELGESVIEDRPNMTRLLVALEKKGWISRRPDPADRRKIEVQLTPQGLRTVEQGIPLALQVRDELRSGIDDADLEQVWRVLDQLEGNLSSILRNQASGSDFDDK